MNQERKRREGYWDFIKGLLIILVFTIHFIGNRAGDWCAYLIRQCASMSVFVFIALAGYFTPILEDICKNEINYVIKRIGRLVVPYVIWTLLFVFVLGNFNLSSCCGFFRTLIWRDLILGYGVIAGYYVVVMLQLAILSPFLVRYARRMPKRLLAFSLAMSVLTSFVAIAASTKWISVGIQSPVPFPGILFTMWIFPYSLGIVLRAYNLIPKLSIQKWRLLLIFGVMFFCVIGEDYLGRRFCIKTQAQFNFSGLLCATVFTLLVFACYGKLPRIMILEVLGRGCYFVYLTHFRLMLILFDFFPCLSSGGNVRSGHLIFAIIFFIFVYWLIIYCGGRFLNLSLRRAIGFS